MTDPTHDAEILRLEMALADCAAARANYEKAIQDYTAAMRSIDRALHSLDSIVRLHEEALCRKR